MQKGGRRTRSKASEGSLLSGIYFSLESRSFGGRERERERERSTEPLWIATNFPHAWVPRACNPVCSLVLRNFSKSLSFVRNGKLHGSRTSPRFLSSCGLYRRRARGTRFFCAAGFPVHRTVPRQNKYDPGASLRYVVPHVPSFHFLPLSLSLCLVFLRIFLRLRFFPNPAHTACFFSLPCFVLVSAIDYITNAHRSFAIWLVNIRPNEDVRYA